MPFDLRGFLLIASGLGLLLFGLSNLAYDGWGSLLTVTGPVILALLLLLLFMPLELRTARPLLDLRLFQRRTFLVGNLISWVAVASLFGSTFLLPGRRRAQKPEPTTIFGVSTQTPEAASSPEALG